MEGTHYKHLNKYKHVIFFCKNKEKNYIWNCEIYSKNISEYWNGELQEFVLEPVIS